MKRYRAIDSDGHILEPADLWTRYIDPKYRERAPRIVTEADGSEVVQIEDARWVSRKGWVALGAFGQKNAEGSYANAAKGGFDPHARITDMDAERIDAAFLYPTLGLFLAGRIDDPLLSAAVCRAYNRWLADYCQPYPERLFGVAMLPMQSVEQAVAEMRYARRELGMKAAFVRANPFQDRTLHDPRNHPIWREAEALDMSVAIHVGGGVPGIGTERFADPVIQHIVSHTMEMMLASVGLIMTGVCERYPGLRLGFLESGGGWMPAWLDRMDRHFVQETFGESALKMKPSEYFRRQCWISFEPVEGSLAPLADYLGPKNILWASDYPHADGFPQARAIIERQNLPAATERTILAEGAIRFYNMGRPEALMAA